MRGRTLTGVLIALLAGLLVIANPGGGWASSDRDGRELTAKLTGAEEVPGPGDPDGRGVANVTLGKGRVCFELAWEGIDAPHMAHIHRGAKGVAGPVVVAFFMRTRPLSDGISMAAGCADAPAGLLREITKDPGGFYVNIHNPRFPAGAIRGQFDKGHTDLDRVKGLRAKLVGATEVPGPGDPDGRGRAAVDAHDDQVCWAVSWKDIGNPTRGHIHEGAEGVAGPVVVPFFENEDEALPDTFRAVAGCADGVDRDLVKAINDDPGGFYVNVHNAEFPAGAIRGQLRDH